MLRSLTIALLLSSAAVGAADYRIETVADGLDHPWSLAFAPSGEMLVTERAGRLRVIDGHGLRAAPVENVPAVYATGQAGLFDVLVDANFATTRWIYLSFADGDDAANRLRVVRANFDGNALHDVTPIFTAEPAKRGSAHYGARMAQLPDSSIAIAVGDAFILREQAQRLDNHFGKIVRVLPDGTVPVDNPYSDGRLARPEIYSYGHRNPQGLIFDKDSGTLFEHEHGPRGGDEINRVWPARNYGWPLASFGVDYTGALVTPFTEYPETEAPLLHWTPSIAPSGMMLYRGRMFPRWRGSLFVSALVEKSVRRIPLKDGQPGEQEILFTELGERLRDVREGPDGSLFLLTDSAHGRVLRVIAN